ncbi:MAG: hypothetical protein P1U42_00355 [Phycisphaerales bacterium]|nr:hypothetical protein [Phycisphaerales bacterium]
MNISRALGTTALIVCSSTAMAGEALTLEPGYNINGLSGTSNVMTPEVRGVTLDDAFTDFAIVGDELGDGADSLFEGTLMTRVVRSNETGLLNFNYRVIDPNEQLSGSISHIEIDTYSGINARVEYRIDPGAPGEEGPTNASRTEDGDIITFDFLDTLSTSEETKFFFTMTDTVEYRENYANATIYLHSGESVTLSIVGGVPVVPTPGAFGLLAAAGCMNLRRRR